MDIVTEDLPLVVEAVIDTEQIFAHLDRQVAAARIVAIVRVRRRGDVLGAVEEQGIGIQQVAGIVLFGKGWPGVSSAWAAIFPAIPGS